MNEFNNDHELQDILQEARQNYQKRIQDLKSSMKIIYNDRPEDFSNKNFIKSEISFSPNRQDTETKQELLQSLSKIQVLQIENENLKNLLAKDTLKERNALSYKHGYSLK